MRSAAPSIDLRPDHWAIVRGILRRHVPDRKVLAFGSRATWTAKDYSDLDLAIMGDEPLSPDATSALAERFGGSDLPFKVDLVDWARIDDGFRGIIRRHGVAVQTPKRVRNAVDAKRRSWSTSMSSATKGEWRESTWGDEIALEYGKARRGHDTNTGSFRVFGSNGLIGWTDAALAPGPGVVLGRKGAYRGVAYSPDPFFVIDTAYYVVSKSKHDMRWLFYAIKHYKLGEIDDGSPIPSTTRAAVYPCELAVPPLAEQRAIAHILGTLDDKIELNRRMNETLEAMARALFKSWFVDFDPVRAKMEGRDTGLPRHLSDLFPDRLVNSEMGKIPEGWKVIPLDAIARFQNGLALQRFRPAQNEARLPVVKIAQLRAGEANSGEWASATIRPECIIEDGDVLFSWSGSLLVKTWCGGRAALNQHLFKVTSGRHPKWFYLNSLLSHLPAFRRIAQDKATTMGHIRRHHLTDALCVVPPDAVIAGISDTFAWLLERQVANELVGRTSVALRETLLPKLISGEIRVGDAEMALESVT